MKTFFRRLLILLIALACLLGPVAIRTWLLGYNQRPYTPPPIAAFKIAATPAPTATPFAVNQTTSAALSPLRRGPVVVDLAHFSRLNPSSFQPLEAALATQGIGLRLWLSNIDIAKLQNYLDFPDQSEALAAQLDDASGIIIVSPFFLWSKAEIALLEKFVANGGRLLLISDPDVQGDFPTGTNLIGAPFGVVFNDDYLYDTVANDENYTHFFQRTFLDQAASLNGSKIAFYGGRSISGAVTAQVRSAPTTLSSLRTGLSDFTTVAIGGQQTNQTAGRVLALSDFDVLTEPYVARFDNQRILTFVANFLGASQRADTLTNFPAYLGKDVALVVDSSADMNADFLGQGAQLQHQLEDSGRTLSLAGTQLLTTTLPITSTGNITEDLIYVADFQAADKTTTLLHDIGMTLVQEVTLPTPTTPASPEPTNTPTPQAPAQPQPLATVIVTVTVIAPELPTKTATPSPTAPAILTPLSTPSVTPKGPVKLLELTATVTGTTETSVATSAALTETDALTTATASTTTQGPTPTPEINFFLQTTDGLRLQAEQTLLIVQRQRTPKQRMVAVLGFDGASVKAGITRLLNNDLKDCMLRHDLAICPVTASTSPSKPQGRPTQESTPTPKTNGTKKPEPSKDTPTSVASKQTILLVDDNAEAKTGETSEADFYLQVLNKAGRDVKLWTTAKDGAPTGDELAKYKWVLWSDAAYASSGIGTDKLQAISDYLGKGGHILLSSRLPFFAVGSKAASPIVEVAAAKDTTIPALVRDLPTDPIALPADLPPVVPLQVSDEASAPAIILRRGPKSTDANAPILLVMTDAQATNSLGARLMIFGMSIIWLPEAAGTQLVNNMAEYMLKDQ